MTAKKKLNSRWTRGNVRYDERTMELIRERYREPYGWHQGARVRRR